VKLQGLAGSFSTSFTNPIFYGGKNAYRLIGKKSRGTFKKVSAGEVFS